MKLIIMLAAMLALFACASSELSPQEFALAQAQMQAKTLTIDCPAGCSVAYRDPRDNVHIPRSTNGWDALIATGQSAERLVTGAVPVLGMGYLGREAIHALRGSGPVTTTTTHTSTVDQSTGDYSGRNSGNTGQIMPGNSGRIDSSDDYTSTPTVVPQPPPVVVVQPEPVIVQPAPSSGG